MERTLGRMTTTIQKVFRRTRDGFFKEITLQFINFLNEDGTVKSSKLDKEIHGGLWRIAGNEERSAYGECEHLFPGQDKPIRLLCLGKSKY